MTTYNYPKEIWDKKECERRSKAAPANHFGDKPPRGIIASSASSYAQYGQTVRFNGGCTHDGEWYEAEHRPLPDIHPDYEFAQLSSWGTIIRKK